MFEKGLIECVAIASKQPEGVQEVLRIPVAHVYETESAIVMAFELPGVNKEDIELSITDEAIEVSAQKKAEENKGCSFYGILQIPEGVITENVQATYNNGILKMELPKAKKQETRKKIEIK
mgnify:CR=1 FL=1